MARGTPSTQMLASKAMAPWKKKKDYFNDWGRK